MGRQVLGNCCFSRHFENWNMNRLSNVKQQCGSAFCELGLESKEGRTLLSPKQAEGTFICPGFTPSTFSWLWYYTCLTSLGSFRCQKGMSHRELLKATRKGRRRYATNRIKTIQMMIKPGYHKGPVERPFIHSFLFPSHIEFLCFRLSSLELHVQTSRILFSNISSTCYVCTQYISFLTKLQLCTKENTNDNL